MRDAGALVAGLAMLSVGTGCTVTARDDPASVVKQLYDAYNHNDEAKARSLIAPNAVWSMYGPQYIIPFAGDYKGPDGVHDFFDKFHAATTDNDYGQRQFIVQGEMVAVPGFTKGTVKATGGQYYVKSLHLFQVHDGQIVRFEEYVDTGTMVEAFEVADPARGRALYTGCTGCHGNSGGGRPELSAPTLAGRDPAYIVGQLRAFRNGTRGDSGNVMQDRANSLPGDRSVRDIAAYIASLPAAPAR